MSATIASVSVPEWLAPFRGYLLPRSFARPVVYKLAGYVAVIAACIFLWISHAIFRTPLARGEYQLVILISVFAGLFGCWLLTWSRCLRARGTLSGLRTDLRKPVVYLRSFVADARFFERRMEILSWLLGQSTSTYEQSLAKAVAILGPLIAIGKPDEKLPPSGAARLYVGNDRWKDVVEQLVALAQFVILRVGQTEGFLWELQHVVSTCDPRKVARLIHRSCLNERRM